MPSALLASLLTLALYALASISGFYGLIFHKRGWSKTGFYFSIGAFLCQTLALALGFHRLFPGGPSSGAYLQLMAWFSLLCGIAAWKTLKSESLILFAALFGMLLFLVSLPFLNISVSLPEPLSAPFFALHIGAIFLGLGCLSIAFVASTLFIFLEKKIKSKKIITGFWVNMPALDILDRINFFGVVFAFPLFTIGLAFGFVWAGPVFDGDLSDPKIVVSLLIWALLAALFHNRLVLGWRGKKPAYLTIAIFILCIFSMLIVNFLLPTSHDFMRI